VHDQRLDRRAGQAANDIAKLWLSRCVQDVHNAKVALLPDRLHSFP
jgi:hypothetical protein